jgi:hypothetical protein
MSAKRSTFDIQHTGKGGPVRVSLDAYLEARTSDYTGPVSKELCEYAANVVARREYGKSGYCRAIRQDGHSVDGQSATYQAFIGIQRGDDCAGRDIWLYWSKPE